MSVADPTSTQFLPPAPPPPGSASIRCSSDDYAVTIPGGVSDLESFRRWARSEQYPGHGRFGYFNNTLWVDLSMEQRFTHNLVKGEISTQLSLLVKAACLGYFFFDRTLLSHVRLGLSTEPDGAFSFWETVKSGALRLIQGGKSGFVELEGTPDMVLEVVSDASVKKDKVDLFDLYWRAGITEYWLVDARKPPLEFQIYRRGPQSYEPQPVTPQGVFSPVFQKHFQLLQETDPLGHPSYRLSVEG